MPIKNQHQYSTWYVNKKFQTIFCHAFLEITYLKVVYTFFTQWCTCTSFGKIGRGKKATIMKIIQKNTRPGAIKPQEIYKRVCIN